ncbi:MAG: 23S rRNA pseudouridine(2605) synthase RluB [Acidiferrobacterales bacterium]|jgi:23S rRNA pseudouridine2605 synthase|nr:23S rRNA pseudouridine(2605) synthase RluB [Acidiferrobacterales bacterium]
MSDKPRRAAPKRDSQPEGEKLQKVLARAGVGSRREMERWIEAGRVSIDGSIATLGDRVLPSQTIRVDGQILRHTDSAPRRRILVYNKPEGELCTRSDPNGRPTVFEHLPRIQRGRWITVGRLDFNTSGLLLVTNDGELANKLMHPSSEIEREYAVRVQGEVTDAMARQLKQGVELEDGPAKFTSIRDAGGEGSNHWYHVTLSEGRNREVRRMWDVVGARVSRLIRVRFGPVMLPRGLSKGHWEDLDDDAARQLLATVGLEHTVQQANPKQRRKHKRR